MRTLHTRYQAGFSLSELMLVIAIAVLLASISIPAYISITRSAELTSAGNLINDQLTLARETAVGLNRQTELRFYLLSSAASGNSSQYRALRIFIYNSSGANPTAYEPTQHLPSTVIISSNAVWSNVLQLTGLSSTNESFTGLDTTGPYVAFAFRPDGSTDLPPPANSSTTYTLTMIPATSNQQAASLPANFLCIQVNPTTGTISTYRP